MELERDKYFFHYTTAHAAFEHILKDRRLRFSRYLEMRDPLENKEWWFSAGGRGTENEDEENQRVSEWWVFNRAANKVRARSFLLSLTVDTPLGETEEEDPFCRGWARARMWEQYAEKNEGVCLVFDRERLTEAVLGSLRGDRHATIYQQEVSYEGAGIMKPIIDIETLAGEVTAETVSSFIEDNYEPLFFHKLLDWQSEHEYRFCTIAKEDTEVFADIGDALHAVIVGERFPTWQRPAAIDACATAGAHPLRLDWSRGEPSVRPLRPRRDRRDEIREVIERTPINGAPTTPPSA